jgi:hypothetical protein
MDMDCTPSATECVAFRLRPRATEPSDMVPVGNDITWRAVIETPMTCDDRKRYPDRVSRQVFRSSYDSKGYICCSEREKL